MIIKNISSKIVGVGEKYLLPDEEHDFPEEIATLDSVKCLAEHGLLEVKAPVVEEKKPAPKKKVVKEEA